MSKTIRVVLDKDKLVRKGDWITSVRMGVIVKTLAGSKDIGQPADNFPMVIREWTPYDRINDLLDIDASKNIDTMDLRDCLIARCTQLRHEVMTLKSLIGGVGGLKWLDMRTEQMPLELAYNALLFVYNANTHEPELFIGSTNIDHDDLYNDGYTHFLVITIPPLNKKAQ